MKKHGHFICRGKVQGVFFRDSARTKAQQLGLNGWIRNCPDGSVEAVAEGDLEVLDDFYRWCQIGPTYASVSKFQLFSF